MHARVATKWMNRAADISKGTVLAMLALLSVACGGAKMDARGAYNGAQNIVDTAAAGKAAAAQCRQAGDAGTPFCQKVDEAFQNISEVAKAIQQNAESAGGAK